MSRCWAAALLCAAALAGCGSDSERPAAGREPLAGDAYVVRSYDHQQRGLQMAQEGRRKAASPLVRRLAARMVRRRKTTLAALSGPRAGAETGERLADLGVSPHQAAEDLGPADLEGVRPFDRSFLALMSRHDEGAVALALAGGRRAEDPRVRAIARQAFADASREIGDINRTLARLSR